MRTLIRACSHSVAMACGALLFTTIGATTAFASISFTVQFEDDGEFDPFRSLLEENVLAAGAWWDEVLIGEGSIDILVRSDPSIPRATGGSLSTAFSHNDGDFQVREEGAAFEVRTGIDINGATPDIEINFNPQYLANGLWLDPDAHTRSAPVPTNRTDAMSVLIHEIGHGLIFNGWMDSTDGTFPGTFKSRFDAGKVFDGSNLFFTGTEAVELYGGPVPLTFGNANHVANAPPRPGSDLRDDLMNGVSFSRGTRYEISPLNLAIARDLGLETVELTQGSVLGDRYQLNLQAFYYQTDVGWGSGESIGEGGVISGLTFGETGQFTLLGNELLVDSGVVALDESTERWTVSLSAADGGEIYDPANPGAWRAMHLRDIGIGSFDSDNLTDFVPGTTAQRIELYAEGVLIDTLDLSASDIGGELQLEQSFPNPGLILFDDGVFDQQDLGVTEIRLIAEVSVLASVLAGNYDGDGVVDQADQELWSLSYGTSLTAGSGADGNGDGVVNAADYAVWRDAEANASAGVEVAVPEPASWALLTLGGLAVGRRARRTAIAQCFRTRAA